MVEVSFGAKKFGDHKAIGVLVSDQLKMDNDAMMIDQEFHGVISKSIKDSQVFKGEFGQELILSGSDKSGEVKNIIVIGTGDESKLELHHMEELGAKVHRSASHLKIDSVVMKINSGLGSFKARDTAALIAGGAVLAAYRFDKYFTKKTAEEKKICTELHVICENEEDVQKAFNERRAIALGVNFARDMVSEVPNILYPESYAERVIEHLEPVGVDVTILGEREMRSLGMGALLGVGQGSARESKIVIMQYNGAENDSNPVCLVGKGVTFDTGGISIKPAANMHAMKYDMGGSASVVGTMKALALRNAKVNVVGIIGLVENMPGGNAQRPGDVVTTMSGQTVEVLNTDAEGRLVLSDCLTYLQENYKPAVIIDLATLTGAILVALANTYGGMFCNDDELSGQLDAAGQKSGELLWRMPLHKDFDKMIDSTVADIANIGNERGLAGSSTAAHFLERFINKDMKWAHLDIAGMAWDSKGSKAVNPKGAVGYGVRLLNQFVQDNYESK